jgi:hypothetical protein
MITLVIALEEAAAGAVFGRAIPMLARADAGGEDRGEAAGDECTFYVRKRLAGDHQAFADTRFWKRNGRSRHSGRPRRRAPFDDLGSQPIVFDNFETELIKAATAEGASPSFENLPDDGSLVARHRTDDMGQRVTEFFGPSSFIRGMGRPGRQVERIVDRRTGQAIWGRPF